jgi:hypothetical protein
VNDVAGVQHAKRGPLKKGEKDEYRILYMAHERGTSNAVEKRPEGSACFSHQHED